MLPHHSELRLSARGGFGGGALNAAKAQAEQITSIDNVAPVCRMASQLFFSTSGLRFRLDDLNREKATDQEPCVLLVTNLSAPTTDPYKISLHLPSAPQSSLREGRFAE